MFVEFQKCRIDLATSRDEDRPALAIVYLDLFREVMFAADGFVMVVKQVHIPKDRDYADVLADLDTDEERDEFRRGWLRADIGHDFIGIHYEAMAWLMTARGKDVRLLLTKAGDHVLVSRDNRQVVAVTGKDIPYSSPDKMRKMIGDVAKPMVDADYHESLIKMDLRKFRQVQMATGENHAVIANPEGERPYLIGQNGAVAVAMGVHMTSPEKDVQRAKNLLAMFVGPEQREEAEDDGTVQDA